MTDYTDLCKSGVCGAKAVLGQHIHVGGEIFLPGECQGHEECPAVVHIHGCYADVEGTMCNDWRAHA